MGVTSLLYVTLLIYIYFILLCFVFINILLVFSPMDPRKQKVLYILAARRRQQYRMVRYLFIFLSQNSKKSKEDCIYKRERKSKNIAIPVRMMAYFAFSLWASFLLLLLPPPPIIFCLWTILHNFKLAAESWQGQGKKKNRNEKKKFDHDSIVLVGLLINLSSPPTRPPSVHQRSKQLKKWL